MESSQLPPCQHSFKKHINGANCQARIFRKFFEQYPGIRQPQNHGWKYDNDQLAIDLKTILPAPEIIIELLKSCDNN